MFGGHRAVTEKLIANYRSVLERTWEQVAGLVEKELFARVRERLDEQARSAEEWRDQINTYFFRKSGVPDAKGRRIY
jgi:alpha-glucuronidase